MEGKSVLSPNATPYTPVSLLFSEVKSGGENKSTEDSKDIGKVVSCQKLDYNNMEYNIQSQGKPLSDAPLANFDFEDDAFPDKATLIEKQTVMDAVDLCDSDLMIDYLSCMFPEISMEFLAASLQANNGDLDGTIHMLEQLEYKGDIPETSEPCKL